MFIDIFLYWEKTYFCRKRHVLLLNAGHVIYIKVKNVKRLRTYMLAMVAVLMGTASVASAQRTGDGSLVPGNYSYVIVLGNDTTFELTDSVFYSISRKVVFPVNEYVIPQNSKIRQQLTEELLPYVNSRSHVLYKVLLRGAASPEGPLEHNQFLARERAKALIDLIGENSRVALALKPETELVAEDYVYLLLLMKQKGDERYAMVADIVNRWIGVDQAALKRELQLFDEGRLWQHLLTNYFPEMRAARMVVVFRKREKLELEWWDILMPEPQPIKATGRIVPITEPIQPLSIPQYERKCRREVLSVKTNLLFDAAATPNVAIEYYPLRGHFTFGASLDCPWWQNYSGHRYWQIRNYQLEARYYTKSGDVEKRGHGNGPAFRGFYLQAYAHAGLYNICFDANHGYEGEGVGAGLGLGYVVPLGKNSRWRLEFGLQAGFFRTWYDPYQWQCPVDPTEGGDLYYYKWTGKPDDFKERQHRFTWLGPTRLGITLTYDLLYRKRTERGVSFRRWEK